MYICTLFSKGLSRYLNLLTRIQLGTSVRDAEKWGTLLILLRSDLRAKSYTARGHHGDIINCN